MTEVTPSHAKEPEANVCSAKGGRRRVRVGVSGADLTTTSELMDVTARRDGQPLSFDAECQMLEAIFSLAPKFVRLPVSNPAPSFSPASVTAAVVVAGEPAAAAAFSFGNVVSINATRSRTRAVKASVSNSTSSVKA